MQHSVAEPESFKPEGPNTCNQKNLAIAICQPWLEREREGKGTVTSQLLPSRSVAVDNSPKIDLLRPRCDVINERTNERGLGRLLRSDSDANLQFFDQLIVPI